MAKTTHVGNNVTIIMTVDINALAAAGTVTVDVLPPKFQVLDGFLSVDVGTTANEGTLGDAGDPNRYIDDITHAASAMVSSPMLNTGKGFKTTGVSDANRTVIYKNTGSAAVPSAATIVTATFIGILDYED